MDEWSSGRCENEKEVGVCVNPGVEVWWETWVRRQALRRSEVEVYLGGTCRCLLEYTTVGGGAIGTVEWKDCNV